MQTALFEIFCFLTRQKLSRGSDIEAGALPSDIIAFVHSYYFDSSNDGPASDDESDLVLGPPEPAQRIDRPFLEYIWAQLLQHPDTHLTGNGQNKSIKLADAEATHGAIWNEDLPDPGGHAVHESSNDPNSNGHSEDAEMQDVPPDQEARAVPSSPQNVDHGDQDAKRGVYVSTSRNRVWMALTGHEPDPIRVRRLEFQCLSQIALAGPRGLLQQELIEVTGQDKRSLPRRTDTLHNDGYIIKRPVVLFIDGPVPKVMHTSLCTFRRYPEASLARAAELNAQSKTTFGSKRRIPKAAVSQVEQSEQKTEIGGTNALHTMPVHNQTLEDDDLPAGGVAPRWTPDRSVYHQMFDVIKENSIKGISIMVGPLEI